MQIIDDSNVRYFLRTLFNMSPNTIHLFVVNYVIESDVNRVTTGKSF